MGSARFSDPVLAGVAADLADRLGLDPVIVRIAFVVLTFAGGAGVLLYALLWLRLVRAPDRVPAPPAAHPADATARAGLALAFVGLLLLLRAVGLWAGDAVVVPVLLGAVGSVLIWSRADDGDRARIGMTLRLPAPVRGFLDDVGRGSGGRDGGPVLATSPLRLVGGIVLIGGAMLGLLAANDAIVAARQLVVVALVAAGGLALLFGPWALRLLETASRERRARIREEERGEIAAHLHDSVLQSLALIQRAGDDPQRMAAIARRQERELRRWLFEGRSEEDATTLAGALEAAVGAVEASHDVHVELVRVGDAPLARRWHRSSRRSARPRGTPRVMRGPARSRCSSRSGTRRSSRTYVTVAAGSTRRRSPTTGPASDTRSEVASNGGADERCSRPHPVTAPSGSSRSRARRTLW